MRRRWLVPLTAASTIAALVGPLPAAIYTVGSDGACTHPNLPSAILTAALTPAADEIRLARNLTYNNQQVQLTDWDPSTTGALTLSGGYDDCPDATPAGRTVVDGAPGNPAFRVNASGGDSSVVTFRRLEISGSGVRGLAVEGDCDVELEDVAVRSNAGGGISLAGGAILSVDASSILHDQDVSVDGAGLHCDGSGVELSGRILSNTTSALGGGIWADGCILSLLGGSEISDNEAFRGGGIYVQGGTFLQGLGGIAGIELLSNLAIDRGGAVFADGNTTSVRLEGTAVVFNEAGESGGGLFASNAAMITMDRPSGSCGNRNRCSELSRNALDPTSGGDGVAAAADLGGTVRLFQTHVESNDFPSVGSSALRASGDGALVLLESVSFWDNFVDRLVEAGSGGRAEMAFVSASDNDGLQGGPARPLVVQQGGTASVNSSLFHPSGAIFLDPGVVLDEADCLVVSDVAHLPPGATRSTVADPLFVSPTTGDLRLRPASPAVDYCDATAYTPTQGDGDGEARGFDLAANPNGSPGAAGGVQDLGFDEVRPLFADGFESASTSNWSSTTP